MNTRKELPQEIDCKNIHYNITGFNQIAVIACNKIIDGKVLVLNYNDLSVLRWFYELFDKSNKNFIRQNKNDGLDYRQITYGMVVKAFPIMNLSKQSIASIFKKLRELNILHHWHVLEGGSFSYYSINRDMRYILEQPAEKAQYSDEILNNKLHTLSNIIDSPIYYNIEGSILYYRPKILLEDTIGVNNTFINKSIRETTEVSPKNTFINQEDIIPRNYNIKLQTKYNSIMDMFQKYNFPRINLKKDTKVCKHLFETLEALATGNFPALPFDSRFAAKHNIDTYLKKMSRPIRDERLEKYIETAIKRFVKMRDDTSVWPQDKTNLKKTNPADFIFSQYKQTSPFLWMLCNPPQDVAKSHAMNSIADKLHSKFKLSVGDLQKILYNNHKNLDLWSERDESNMLKTTYDICAWHESNKEDLLLLNTPGTSASSPVMDVYSLLTYIGDWLQEGVSAKFTTMSNYMNFKGWQWKSFCEYIEDRKGTDMDVSNKTYIKQLRKKQRGADMQSSRRMYERYIEQLLDGDDEHVIHPMSAVERWQLAEEHFGLAVPFEEVREDICQGIGLADVL